MAQRSNGEETGPAEGFPGGRELIVIAKSETGLRARPEEIASVTGADVDPLRDLLASEGATLQPLFGVSEERLHAEAARVDATGAEEVPDLSVYYQVQAPDERLDDLAESLRQMDGIEAAYVKPPAEPAQFRLNEMARLTSLLAKTILRKLRLASMLTTLPHAVVAGEQGSISSTSSGVGASIMKT
jgi:hypothetical protein